MTSDRPTMAVPRRELAGSMGVGGLVGGAVAWGVVMALGGGSGASVAAALVVLLGVVLTVWPLLLLARVAPTTFALAVLLIGTLRLLVILGIGLALDVTQGYPRMEFWMGVVGGASVVLIVETAALVVLVSRMGRTASGDGFLSTDGGARG